MDIKEHTQYFFTNPAADTLYQRIAARAASVGVIGLGYVGLPLLVALTRGGFTTIGLDVDSNKIAALNAARSYIQHIASSTIAEAVASQRFRATTNFSAVAEVDAILICVPTPLTRHREPDLSYIVATVEAITPHLKRGHLIVLESTTFPGTTRDVIRPILERSSLKSGVDFFLAYSPEREDPGNSEFNTAMIPKVVGGDGDDALALTRALYEVFVPSTIPVSNPETAEAVKLTENIFRSVNIALVNELKIIFGAMDIDIWEVIDAAKSKPFGYMPFYPGPGLGGHCIPIDPFYLTWKAREYNVATRFIELAGEINTTMPAVIVERVARALSDYGAKGLKDARILLLGIAYKKNVDDARESPSFKIMELLEGRGAQVSFHDPHIAEIPPLREHPEFARRRSIELNAATLAAFDLAVVATDHDAIDYRLVAEHCPLVVDTRNALGRAGIRGPRIVKA